MKSNKSKLRVGVLTWTLITSIFFWTSTMRMLFKPEVSEWSMFYFSGKGFSGDFWFPPLVALIALFIFYLEGRGKLRTLYHLLLLVWQLAFCISIIYGDMQSSVKISFGTWGVNLSLIWLVIPFVLFLVLSVILVVRERKGVSKVPEYNWTTINRRPLIIALILFPLAFVLFFFGEGFNWLTKMAVVAAIVQWILITETVGRPYTSAVKLQENSTL